MTAAGRPPDREPGGSLPHGRFAVGDSLTALVTALSAFTVVLADVRDSTSDRFDLTTAQALAGLRAPRTATAFEIITRLGSPPLMAAVMMAVSGWWVWRLRSGRPLLIALLGLAGTLGSVTAVQQAVDRDPLPGGGDVPVAGAAFPSCDAAVSAMVLVLCALVLGRHGRRGVRPRLWGITLLLIALVGLAQTAQGRHCATDVLAGWALGVAWAVASNLLAVLWRRRDPRRPPP